MSDDLRIPAISGSLGDTQRRVSLRSFYAFDLLRFHFGPERAAQLIFNENAEGVLDALRIGALS